MSLPDDTLGHLLAAAKKQWKRYRKELQRCQTRFSVTAVHSSRIEMRRLLSFSELLAPFLTPGPIEKIRACLKRHLDVFDDLRDTQVQRKLLKQLCGQFEVADCFRQYLRKREKRLVLQTRKEIKRARTKRLGNLLRAARENAGTWLMTGTPEKNSRMILRTVGAAFDRTVELKRRIDPARCDTIHCTRVAFKRFRYMVEALAGFVRARQTFLQALQDYQTLMGNVQDMEVLLMAFENFASKKDPVKKAANAFRKELLRRKQELIQVYLERADELYSFWPRPDAGGPNGGSSLIRAGRNGDSPKERRAAARKSRGANVR